MAQPTSVKPPGRAAFPDTGVVTAAPNRWTSKGTTRGETSEGSEGAGYKATPDVVKGRVGRYSSVMGTVVH